MSTRTSSRKTAAERREAVLDAALTEFAARGFDGASTDAIARRVGISQPYLFRLFGTKKDLFIASVERCFADTLERFERAAEGLEGHDALMAMGAAYGEWILTDSRRLRAQMQAYAACDDPAIRTAVRRGFGRIVAFAESTGATREEVHHFFARGMLLNVIASMELLDSSEPWAARMIEVCRGHQ
jgi:AcrR family transcriptional regulator